MSTEDNITLTENQEQPPVEVKLTDIEVTNENMALNIMVSFLNVAQKRGAFTLDEAAKIWECIQKFVSASQAVAAAAPAPTSE